MREDANVLRILPLSCQFLRQQARSLSATDNLDRRSAVTWFTISPSKIKRDTQFSYSVSTQFILIVTRAVRRWDCTPHRREDGAAKCAGAGLWAAALSPPPSSPARMVTQPVPACRRRPDREEIPSAPRLPKILLRPVPVPHLCTQAQPGVRNSFGCTRPVAAKAQVVPLRFAEGRGRR